MKDLKINEWQEFSIKKDVKSILLKMGKKTFDIALIIQIPFSILSLLASSTDIFPESDRSSWCIVFICLAFALPVLIISGPYIIKFLYALILKIFKIDRKISVKPDIEKFDNDINQDIMTAFNFYDYIQNSNLCEINIYYFIQANYYINSCIKWLVNLGPKIEKVCVKPGCMSKSKIEYIRIKNIVDIILFLRYRLTEKFNEIIKSDINNSSELSSDMNLLKQDNANYDQSLSNFIELFNTYITNNDSEKREFKLAKTYQGKCS